MSAELFLILSLDRTGQAPWGPVCVWWQPNGMGYTASIGEAGRYTLEQVREHADPPHHVAIPLSAIEVPASKAKALVKAATAHGIGRISRWKSTPVGRCPVCGSWESCDHDPTNAKKSEA